MSWLIKLILWCALFYRDINKLLSQSVVFQLIVYILELFLKITRAKVLHIDAVALQEIFLILKYRVRQKLYYIIIICNLSVKFCRIFCSLNNNNNNKNLEHTLATLCVGTIIRLTVPGFRRVGI